MIKQHNILYNTCWINYEDEAAKCPVLHYFLLVWLKLANTLLICKHLTTAIVNDWHNEFNYGSEPGGQIIK